MLSVEYFPTRSYAWIVQGTSKHSRTWHTSWNRYTMCMYVLDMCICMQCAVHSTAMCTSWFSLHITAYMESCTCYMLKCLHMHIKGVASSQAYLCNISMQPWNHVVSWVAFHKILCIDSSGHLDAYKNIAYTMEWIHMLALHVSNGVLAIIAEAFIVASMLPKCVAGRYYGVHKAFCFMEAHVNLRWWVTKFF